MRLTFLGGADEVGASGTLIEIAGKKLLVDAGIRISAKQRHGVGDDQLPDLRLISESGGPDYILVTHAHTDHTGALPLVVERYPHVPVFATEPTIALVRILQADAQRIMKTRQEQESELPLFDEIAVQRLLDSFQPVEFRRTIKLGERVQATYHASGHIVGAGSIVIESDEGTLVMSGDVSLSPQRAVVRAALPNIKADALVLESTYGGKLHANRAAEEKRLIETLRIVIDRGGKALIPAFALGRAQEVLQIILKNRALIDAPVYVDGMVRAVCRAYSQFTDWLPEETVKSAKDQPLFFRESLKSVETLAQRSEIANGAGAAVIVSSSGMLTGGPSAYYAKALAGDLRNAILLTGYQDEESPARFLQKAIRDRELGEDVTIRIEGQPITVRCELGTYSLSAHADEAELVSVAEAFAADEIALVHGDAPARHSLATALRARGRVVRLPQSGQTFDWNFTKKPWRIAQSASGQHAGAVDAAALWGALAAHSGDFYSARELAQMWAGEPDRAAEVASALANDGVYFSADWRQRDTFQVHSADQVARAQRQRAIMLANPDLVGKLIVLRDSNNRVRVGVVENMKADGFEAVVLNAKGRNYPADALVWVICHWNSTLQGTVMLAALNAKLKAARALQESLLPFEKRQKLVANGTPVDPLDLLPANTPDREIALLAVVLTLAGDGAEAMPDGLLPKHAFSGEPLEQNAARQLAFESFPPEARLRKVGLEIHRKRLSLTFDFPSRAQDQYAEQIEQVGDQTGWEVYVSPQTNQQALGTALVELLASGGQIVKGPSFHMDRSEVQAEVEGVSDAGALERAFLDLTGYRLRVNAKRDDPGSFDSGITQVSPAHQRPQMEINAAYGLIRDALEPFGLYRTSLKQGQIVLSFISPQIGARHRDAIARLAEETGYVLSIHPHPDQNMILQKVLSAIRGAGWQIRKGPGLHVDRAEVSLSLVNWPDEAEAERVGQGIETETGYRLVIKP